MILSKEGGVILPPGGPERSGGLGVVTAVTSAAGEQMPGTLLTPRTHRGPPNRVTPPQVPTDTPTERVGRQRGAEHGPPFMETWDVTAQRIGSPASGPPGSPRLGPIPAAPRTGRVRAVSEPQSPSVLSCNVGRSSVSPRSVGGGSSDGRRAWHPGCTYMRNSLFNSLCKLYKPHILHVKNFAVQDLSSAYFSIHLSPIYRHLVIIYIYLSIYLSVYL